jgi:hypothetical protein
MVWLVGENRVFAPTSQTLHIPGSERGAIDAHRASTALAPVDMLIWQHVVFARGKHRADHKAKAETTQKGYR